ncbi:AAA family ATPase [Bifidobacterium sp. SMB2]|uniref:DNA 3'-5' helicase n=1 Tax=Bifidobacterium saimiriisciurei TaxID=2661627 RepID=A0ABX0CBY6_9BIFI|nr:ATP-dependent helicase [Bifidobacterium saimiriisciurei]NEG95904.1 AAA family ATPase [Bifidobacterium sp. SMB2]NEH11751.1 AAA family ATPase [Bifidobacterium saimiriisciurei]
MKSKAQEILEGLDDSQTAAAQAVDGPVRIMAGAGAGKTRTITHRIAYACESGAWNPSATLAVTFSVKAAAEMRARLSALGVPQVKAATFHSAALHQLRQVWPELSEAYFPSIVEEPRLLAEKAFARVVGRDVDGVALRALLAEINWTKVSLIAPADYARVCAATHRQPPADLTPDQMADVIDAYEQEKTNRNRMDFNDILLMACHVMERFEEAAATIRSRVRWITVDEYQDVSPLQHRLMRLWLGGRDSVCVVGDPAQTIYSFAGATSHYLLHFPEEFHAMRADIRLETDYRSTPQVVHYANRILAASPYAADYLVLRSGRDAGRRVQCTSYATDEQEAQGVARRIARLVTDGVSPNDIAVLMRINAQGAMVRAALNQLRIRSRVRTEYGQSEATLIDSSGAAAKAAAIDLAAGQTGAVSISTIHAAKGLEWKHVFLIGCSEGLIPFGSPAPGDVLEEERRLLYVGVTRGEDTVDLSFATRKDAMSMQRRSPSRFLR